MVLAAGGFLAIMLPIVIASMFFSRQTEAAWWDEGYGFRQRASISHSNGTDLTDFQVKITIDTASLISEGKMQSDCDDVRVVASNGQSLPYWIEESGPGACNMATTAIWVKVTTVFTSGTNIFLYYGNPVAESTANGDSVFAFFDDFNTSLSKWSSPSCGAINVSNGTLTWSTPTSVSH